MNISVLKGPPHVLPNRSNN